MSSNISKEKIHAVSKDELSKNRPINIKEITIPFSSLLDHVNPSYIYNGDEKIPFCECHPEYQKILLIEFVE